MPSRCMVPMAPAIEVVAPRETPHTSKQSAANLQCRLALTEGTIKTNTVSMESIQVGCFNMAVFFVFTDDVRPEGVKADAYDIHSDLLLLLFYSRPTHNRS